MREQRLGVPRSRQLSMRIEELVLEAVEIEHGPECAWAGYHQLEREDSMGITGQIGRASESPTRMITQAARATSPGTKKPKSCQRDAGALHAEQKLHWL